MSSDHQCPYPASGCTAPDCPVTAGRFDERVVEALIRIDHEQRIIRTGPGELGCRGVAGWHSWTDHRRHVAEAQLAEMRWLGLISPPTADAQVAAMREVADTAARITELESQLAAARSALAAVREVRAAQIADRDTT